MAQILIVMGLSTPVRIREDKTKVYSWPAYLAIAREAVQCPSAVLLVICPDPREADKCRKVIRMGHPGWDLYPIVIDPAHAPADAGAGPYLTLFLACLPALDMSRKTTPAGCLPRSATPAAPTPSASGSPRLF